MARNGLVFLLRLALRLGAHRTLTLAEGLQGKRDRLDQRDSGHGARKSSQSSRAMPRYLAAL